MTAPRLAVLVNPNARSTRHDTSLAARLRALAGGAAEVWETLVPDDVDALCTRFAARGVEVVATCGGDGSNMVALTALARAYKGALPRLALLGGGTVNTVAHNLGVHGTPEELLAGLLSALAGGRAHVRQHDTLAVNGRLGFLFAAAMGARFLQLYYHTPEPTPSAAMWLTARTMASSFVGGPLARELFAPIDMEIIVDDERLPPSRPRLLVASTVPDVGMHMRVAWQAGSVPGRFHFIASELSTVRLAMQLGRVWRGQPLVANGAGGAAHIDRLAERVVIRAPHADVYTLDGELFREAEMRIAIGPRIELVGANA